MDIPEIMRTCEITECVLVAIPRAKAFNTYTFKQMYLREAISDAADMLSTVSNGSTYVTRLTNTRTTHLPENTGRYSAQSSVTGNDGSEPYPGITIETCTIDSEKINGKIVILVDDIYTKNCNIDEDCIQALYDNGAQNVIFYAIAYSKEFQERKLQFSEMALRTLILKERDEKLTTAKFWKEYAAENIIRETITDDTFDLTKKNKLLLDNLETSIDGFICVFDDDFPEIRQIGKRNDRPYLLFYKGDISLLKQMDNNVAVIGLTNPIDEIVRREINVVKKLVENECTIVSGLAKGCDTVAHRACLDAGGKTIAVLPSTIEDIYPKANQSLAEEIILKGGLLISEYYTATGGNRFDWQNRIISRDRLQAMFSKAVLMIASYRQRGAEWDSGARHAMEAAEHYEIKTFVLYNEKTDSKNEQFELNRFYLNIENESITGNKEKERKVSVEILKAKSINEIKNLKRYNERQHSGSIFDIT